MLANSFGIGEPPERLDRDLERAGLFHRRLIENAARHLDVLSLQRQRHVGRGQAERLQAIRIEPDAHRIVAAAEHRDRADAVDPGQRVLDLQGRVVGDEQRVARAVGRDEMHDHHQVGRALVDGDADRPHVGRQPRLRDRHAVLHLHLRDIEIGAEIEAHRDGEASVRRRVRRHVEHVLDAVDLLLDRRDRRRRDHVGAGARILPGDLDHRRRDFGILRDRQTEIGDRAEDHDHDRDHGGEDRPVDEEMGQAHRRAPATWSWLAGAAACGGRALLLRRDLATRPRLHETDRRSPGRSASSPT